MAFARSESMSSLVTEDGFEERWPHGGSLHSKDSVGSTTGEEDEGVGRHRSCGVDTIGQRKCADTGTEHDSVGSLLHDSGRCRPCAFFHGKGCKSGASCLFCHKCTAQERGRRKRWVRRMRADLLSTMLSGDLQTLSLGRSLVRAPMTAAPKLHLHHALQVAASNPVGVADPANRLHPSPFFGVGSAPIEKEAVAVHLPSVNASSLATSTEWLGVQQPPVLDSVPSLLYTAMPHAWRTTAAVGQHHAQYVQCVNIYMWQPSSHVDNVMLGIGVLAPALSDSH